MFSAFLIFVLFFCPSDVHSLDPRLWGQRRLHLD